VGLPTEKHLQTGGKNVLRPEFSDNFYIYPGPDIKMEPSMRLALVALALFTNCSSEP
jgi:hypothetical protein